MSFDHERLKFDILSYVGNWTDNPNHPPGGATYSVPEIISDIPSLDELDAPIAWKNDHILIATRELIREGHLTGVESFGGRMAALQLTNSGRSFLDHSRRDNNVWGHNQTFFPPPPEPSFPDRLKKNGWRWARSFIRRLLFTAIPAIAGFILLLATEIISPAKACPYIPTEISVWLKPCDEIREKIAP